MTDHDPTVDADAADLADQRRGVTDGAAEDTPATAADVPEADAVEQAQERRAATATDGGIPLDADEADALDQRTTVAGDDRDEWRGDDGGS